MTRKKRNFTRDVVCDPLYGNENLSLLIRVLMKSGKKGIAERACYSALDYAAKETGEEGIQVFEKVLASLRPQVEVRSRRVGGATYQVPTDVRPRRSLSLALRWLKVAANSRGERTLAERLGREIVDAYNQRGIAIKKRDETFKMAEANKAFSHFKW